MGRLGAPPVYNVERTRTMSRDSDYDYSRMRMMFDMRRTLPLHLEMIGCSIEQETGINLRKRADA